MSRQVKAGPGAVVVARGGDDTFPVESMPPVQAETEHPRVGPVDESRLRSCLQQLARGLSALHAAGKVHRDVKPSNILVDSSGNLFLLDFGLITDADFETGWTEDQAVGTAAYMAPEQAMGRRVGPEADWYSVGVLLYEALTGIRPFTGSNLQVLLEKQQSEPVPPSRIAPGAPADLAELCAELLRLEPASRPPGASILRRLDAVSGASLESMPSLSTRSTNTNSPLFIGREGEIAVLDSAFRDTSRGRGISVVLSGESGVGKSTPF